MANKIYEAKIQRSKTPERMLYQRILGMKKYGIDFDEFQKMLISQNGGCAICGKTQPGKRDFHIDHDHKTGKVRGLLCVNCNLGIGNMQDDPSLLRLAIRYLERFSADAEISTT